jgi:hypothetical protein
MQDLAIWASVRTLISRYRHAPSTSIRRRSTTCPLISAVYFGLYGDSAGGGLTLTTVRRGRAHLPDGRVRRAGWVRPIPFGVAAGLYSRWPLRE